MQQIFTFILFASFLTGSLPAGEDVRKIAEIESPKNNDLPPIKPPADIPAIQPPITNDHGFVFPLEDLIDQPSKHGDRFYTEFFNMLATLGLIIAIILIAAWLLRRILNTRLEQINTTSTIKILERRALSPKSAVYLLEIYDKTFAIAETQNGIVHLGDINIPPEPEPTQETRRPFPKI